MVCLPSPLPCQSLSRCRWGTIALFTVLTRVILLRATVNQQKHNARLAAIGPQQQKIMETIKAATAAGDGLSAQFATGSIQALWKENDVHPIRTMGLLLRQMPIFLGMFWGIRRLAENLPQLQAGGFAWVSDLTLPDPYWILPCVSMLFTNMVFKVRWSAVYEGQADGRQYGADGIGQQHNVSPAAPHMTNIVGAVSVLGVLFVHSYPAVRRIPRPS